jgi:hypothetical protein
MPAIPFALSVQHFVNSVGADAGFAAIIGLAILVLLYFAQARETASLRDQVEDSADLIQHLEQRLEQVARSSTAPAPAPGTVAPAPGTVASPPAAAIRPAPAPAIAAARTAAAAPVSARRPAPVPVGAGAPAAPAGVGAPALSAATRLIPADPSPIAVRANGTDRTAAPVAAGGAAVMTPPSPPPATAAGAANGGTGRVPTATPASAGATGVQPPLRAPVRTDAPAGRAPTGPPRRPPSLPPRSSSPGRSRFSRVAIAMVTLLGVVAVVIVLLIVTSSGGGSATHANASSSGAGTSAAPATHHRTRKATALTPASITVAVLNGTSTANLAQAVATRLQTAGFKHGTIGNASDQTQTATVVGYLPQHRAAALLVARSLKLGPASVQAVDQSNETVACQASSTPCTTQVVVTVGSDLASNT